MNPMKQISDEEVSSTIRYLDPELNGEAGFGRSRLWKKKAGHWAGIALLIVAISVALALVLWNWLPSVP